MDSGHSHGGTDVPAGRASPRVRLVLAAAVVPFAVLTVVCTFLFWPKEPPPKIEDPYGLVIHTLEDATVVEAASKQCFGGNVCQTVTIHLDTGVDIGKNVLLPESALSAGVPPLEVGDKIVVSRDDLVLADPPVVSYSFADHQRRAPLAVLALLFSVLVIAIARWRGVAAIIGLAFTYVVLFTFVIPALIRGTSPVGVALTGSALIMFVILYVADGVNARTTTALLGTLISLAFTGVLAWYFVGATSMTGAASEEATYIHAAGATFSLSGLLLAGIIIGALGVFNDVTVTQVSAVWEVHHANREQGVIPLYRAGMRIGRDHIASVVDTLVLAYAGATLPLLILFFISQQPATDVITSEIVAEEIVRTLVGSIGLVLSVPITTLLAAAVVPRSELIDEPDLDAGRGRVSESLLA